MNNAYTLFKVLMKNTEMKLPKEGKKGTTYLSLGIIALCCIMIPCCFVVGFVSYIMTEALTAAGSPLNGLLAEIHIMSAFSIVFGVLVIFQILFFSSDREHLVPLPFRSHEILAAKFSYAFFAESIMEFLVLFSMFVGFFLSYGWHPVGILTACAATFLIPLLPMVYCALLGLIVMSLLKNIKNTNLLHQLSSLILLAFVALFLLSFRNLSGITIENYVNSLAGNTNLFVEVLNKVFFTVPFLLYALEKNSILALIMYLLLSMVAVAVLLFAGHFLYPICLYSVAALGTGKKELHLSTIKLKKRTPFFACLQKELRVLTRTKAYSVNCVFINLLWPILIVLAFSVGKNKDTMVHFLSLYQSGNAKAGLFVTLGIITMTFLATAMNTIASTAFTREGAHLSLLKYIPVPYKIQVYAKAFVSILITYPAILLCLILLTINLSLSLWSFVYYGITTLCIIILTTVLGMVLDSAHPHSTWDDEYSALRGNLNAFFDMAIVMVVSFLVVSISILLLEFTRISLPALRLALLVLLLVSTLLAAKKGLEAVTQNISSSSLC